MSRGLHVNRVAILGAGTMGAQIAAHFANAGFPTYLYDLPSDGKSKNATVEAALGLLKKLQPAPLASPDKLTAITPGNYDDDLSHLAQCDLIIEAIAEVHEIKCSLFEKIAPHIHDHAILASNSSGLSINKLADALPEKLRQRFLGVHFFNPPRYLPLVELIPSKQTPTTLMDDLETFLTTYIGKSVVRAKDTPNFIANRVGVCSMLITCHHTEAFGIGLEVADKLTGKPLGRPNSATYRTADLVGLDILGHVIDTLKNNLNDDPLHPYFKVPSWIQQCMDAGALGAKTKKGLYEKKPDGLTVLDLKTGEYRPSDGKPYAGITQILSSRDWAKRFKQLRDSDHAEAQFLLAIFRDLFHYCALIGPDIAESVRDIDLAIRYGFGWKQGPFEIWQSAGFTDIRDWLNAEIAAGNTLSDQPLPDWIQQLDSVYTETGAYQFETGQFVGRSMLPVYQRQYFPDAVQSEVFDEGETVYENAGARIWHQGDRCLIISFKTKMCVISDAVLQALQEAVKIAEADYDALIIWQRHSDHFSAGADLMEFAQKFIEGGIPVLDESLKTFQQTLLGLRYARVPVVAAARGYAFGGGCETLMHCDHIVAALESYIGLVEVGVGILPAAGGCKEMAWRAAQAQHPRSAFEQYYKNIAMAEVAKSAYMAQKIGYLRPSDTIIMHPQELLYVAKAQAKALASKGYRPPQRPSIPVFGRDMLATVKMMVANLRDGHFASEYDAVIATHIAEVMTGGDLDAKTLVDEDWFLRREREAFLTLVQNDKTHARIEYMLENGKPLRN